MIHQEMRSKQVPKTPRFLYFGRLTHEKWFDRIISLAEYFLDNPTIGILEICWDWEMKENFLSQCFHKKWFLDAREQGRIDSTEEYSVIYHGRLDREFIQPILNRSHYTLMPSRFLETFWLSALESIEKGVPVIGSTKWGLYQFLLSHHGVSDERKDSHTTRAFLKKFDEVARSFSHEHWKSESAAVMNIAERYARDTWKQWVQKELSFERPNKILLLTDFSAPIGWIETHVQSVKNLLQEMGHECQIISAHSGKTKNLRIASFLLAYCNIFFAFRLKKIINEQRPDVIWMHSVNRAIWPVGLYPLKNLSARLVVTYHDLGFTTPYPSKTFHESEVPEFTLSAFFESGRWLNGIFGGVAALFKFFLLSMQKSYFRQASVHFVPSEFLVKYVTYQFWEDAHVVVLPHCKDIL